MILGVASLIGVALRPDIGHALRWRGQAFSLRFGDVELELSDGIELRRWQAVIGFSQAPLRYPVLGLSGCLQFFDARFLGENRFVELESNQSFSGTTV